MSYVDHFRHADDVIAHLNTVVPGLPDPLLKTKYAGFVTVAAVTVYELAIKDIFCEFGRKKHKILGAFSESYFKKINGRVTLDHIRKDYCLRYGDVYVTKFKTQLESSNKTHLAAHRRDLRSSYSNLIVWRNAFAHEGAVPATVTYSEVVQAYQDGKEVIHSLAATMIR
jgi:hypothetical protein